MQELAKTTGFGQPEPTPPTPAVPATVGNADLDRLQAWAETARAIWPVAEQLAAGALTPKAFRDKPHDAFGAIMAGHEMGLDPLASIRSFHVINGTAAPYARTLHSVAIAKGHTIQITEESATRVAGRACRRGSTHWAESTWTIERAHQAGLTKNPVYKQHPQAMLAARVLTDLVRRVCPEVALGLATVEEIQTSPLTGGDVPPPPSDEASTTVKRRPKAPNVDSDAS